MRHTSLCSGYGGFTVAADSSGVDTVFHCEIDKTCHKVLRKNWPNVPIWDDLYTVPLKEVPTCDVVSAGTPCQNLSVAGNRAGLEGKESRLFYAAVDLVYRLRQRDNGTPRFFFWENVLGAFSSSEGRDFRTVLQTLLNIGARDIGWRVLDARWFGIPQRRRRVFLVADFGGRCAEQILSLAQCVSRNPASFRKEREGLAGVSGTLPANCGGTSRPAGQANELDSCVPICADGELNSLDDYSGTLQSQDGDRQPIVAFNWQSGGDFRLNPSSENCNTLLSDQVPAVLFHENKGSHVAGAKTARRLRAGASHSYQMIAYCLKTSLHSNDPGNGRESAIADSSMRVRRFTPLETTRLMGLPDDHFLDLGLSDNAIYRMCGNGVVPACIVPIFKTMREVYEGWR